MPTRRSEDGGSGSIPPRIGPDQRPGLHHQQRRSGLRDFQFRRRSGSSTLQLPADRERAAVPVCQQLDQDPGQSSDQVWRRHPLRHEPAHPQRQQPDWRIQLQSPSDGDKTELAVSTWRHSFSVRSHPSRVTSTIPTSLPRTMRRNARSAGSSTVRTPGGATRS